MKMKAVTMMTKQEKQQSKNFRMARKNSRGKQWQ